MKIPYLIDFRLPETANDLAPYLGIDADLFKTVIASSSRSEFYFQHLIPKRSRHRREKFRIVWQAALFEYLPLVDAHKAFARRFDLFARLADPQFPHEAAYGYVRHRGTRDNAAIHSGAPLLLRADLQNFFPSISTSRLVKRFLELGIQKTAAEALATFATINDSLPLGLNASPMLANLVCVELDKKIQELAQDHDCKYTRYADDISISGNANLPPRSKLEKIIVNAGFNLSNDKFRITKIGQAHYVTGLSISDVKGPHVPRRMKRKLRQELHYCKKFGIEDHLYRIEKEPTVQSGVNRLDGTVHYVSHIEASIGSRLKSLWSGLLEKEGLKASYDPIETRSIRHVSCFIDETEITFGNKKYLALGLMFTENVDGIIASTIATLREHRIEDPFYAGNKDALEKKGMHFSDAHPDLRTAYIKVLAGLPYRAFVIFAELKGDEKYEDIYISLLKKSLRGRFIWYDRAVMKIVFEENSKIKTALLKMTVNAVYQSLEETNNRRPIKEPEIFIGKKLQPPCFAVPDFLLAIFARFARFNEKADEKIRQHQFERLRDKYRTIVDADTEVEFSRKRPFMPWVFIDE